MSQIAQQDHLYIEVADLSNLTDAEVAQLLSARKRNVLDDVILVTPTGHSAVVGWSVDDVNAPTELSVYVIHGGEMFEISISL